MLVSRVMSKQTGWLMKGLRKVLQMINKAVYRAMHELVQLLSLTGNSFSSVSLYYDSHVLYNIITIWINDLPLQNIAKTFVF